MHVLDNAIEAVLLNFGRDIDTLYMQKPKIDVDHIKHVN